MKLRNYAVFLMLFISSFSQAEDLNCDEKKALFESHLINVLKPKVVNNFNSVRLKSLPNGLPGMDFVNEHMTVDKLFFCDLYSDSENQPEFSKPFWAYNKSSDPDFVLKLKKALIDHKEVLSEIEEKHGVDKEIIAAIWGSESKFGEKRGEIPVLQGVSHKAFMNNKTNELGFWDKNVIYALQIMHSYNLSHEDFLGSWSGAFGHTQFIPSTYNLLALDFDGDGISNHWHDDPRDALASAAKLLQESGWNKNLSWGEEVVVPENFNYSEFLRSSEGGKQSKRDSFWRSNGFVKNKAGDDINWESLGGRLYLVSPQGSENTSYLLSSKFRKLKAYNNADAYALSILFLAEASKGNLISVEPDLNRRPLSRSEKKLIQALLNQNGQNAGLIDGRIGQGTKSAISAYQQELGLAPGLRDGIPSEVLLLSLVEKYPEWTKRFIEVDYPEISEDLYRVYSQKIISHETRPLTYHERRELQIKLQERGLYSGNIDGIAGKGTERGVLIYLNQELPLNSSYMSRDVYNLIVKSDD